MSINKIVTNLTDKVKAAVGDTQRTVNFESDLSDLTSGGEITLTTGTYNFVNQAMFFSNKFKAEPGANIVIEGTGANQLLSLNGGILFDMDGANLFILRNIFTVQLIPGAQLWAPSNVGLAIIVDFVFFVSAGASQSFGTFDNCTFVSMEAWQSIGYTTGVTFTRIGQFLLRNLTWFSSGSGTGTAITFGQRCDGLVSDYNMVLGASEFGFDVAPDRPGNIVILLRNGGLLDRVGTQFKVAGTGTTGTFTEVAPDAVTPETITSVSSGTDGAARFNFTPGPTLFVNQRLTNINYIVNTDYNVEKGFVSVTGAGFFEIDGIDFIDDVDGGIGSFSGDRVLFTDTGTALVEGDSVTTDTTGSIDYDTGAIVYNVTTNNFQLSLPFTSDQAGAWSTESLNEKDILLRVTETNIVNSFNIGSVIATGVTAETVINTIDVWEDLNLNGVAVVGSNNEQWKLISATTAELIYAGLSNQQASLIASLSAVSSGGTQEFEFRVLINDVPTSDAIEIPQSLGTNIENMSLVVPVSVLTGDRVRVQTRNIDGSSNVTVQLTSLEIK